MKKEERRLNVGFVFDDSLDSFDGVSQYVKALGQWLAHQGHSVSYLVGETKITTWADGEVHSLARNQEVTFNGNQLSIPTPAKRSVIRKVLAAGQYDVLHVQMPHSPFMAGRVIKAAEASTAVVGTFHILPSGKLASIGSRLLRLLYGNSLRRFDKFFSVSPAAGRFAKSAFGINSEVLPNVVDTKKFKVPHPAKKDRPEIIFLGRLVKRKGCLYLLRAFELARKNGLEAKLIIAGNGPLRTELEQFVKQRQLDEHVEFLGFVPESEKAQLLARADIACFPATGGESFGIVLIEAMAAGAKVVLGGDNPGYRTVLGEKSLLLVDPRDTDEFAKRLHKLINDQTSIPELQSWLRHEVKKYEIGRVGHQLEDAYLSAIAKRRQNIHNVANER